MRLVSTLQEGQDGSAAQESQLHADTPPDEPTPGRRNTAVVRHGAGRRWALGVPILTSGEMNGRALVLGTIVPNGGIENEIGLEPRGGAETIAWNESVALEEVIVIALPVKRSAKAKRG